MFFFLSKTLLFLTTPIVLICILLLLAIFLRSSRWKYRLLRIAFIILLFCSNDFITNEFMRAWEIPPTPMAEIKKHYTWGIVLSGITKPDMVPKDRIYFQRGADRIIHALKLYKEGHIDKILISGGSGSLVDTGLREADDLASTLVMMGVRPEDIMAENKSRNTHESAGEVKSILEKITKPEECLLITSAFHMRRSSACFKKAGWAVDSFTTDFMSHPRVFSIDGLLIPHLEALSLWNVLAKEWVGYLAYALAGYI